MNPMRTVVNRITFGTVTSVVTTCAVRLGGGYKGFELTYCLLLQADPACSWEATLPASKNVRCNTYERIAM